MFEAVRLVMVQRLLNSAEYKMDPLVSLYYFAPVCAIMNVGVALIFEVPRVSMTEVYQVGLLTLLLNAVVAFALNVSAVFLVGLVFDLIITALINIDWEDFVFSPDSLRRAQGYSFGFCFYCYLGHTRYGSSVFRL